MTTGRSGHPGRTGRSGHARHVAPAVGLFFLAPLVAEFLLGNLPITMLPALVVLAPMYGGGALLVRELARRRGLGWPSIVLLAAAYAVFEEAYTTQTLFNPNYLKLNLHLLDPAYIPFLGIGGWWTVYVLTLHTVWSISTSIALAEALVPDRASTPWLGRVGFGVTAILLTLGAVMTTWITLKDDRFVASIPQFAGAALAIAALVAAALRFPRRTIGDEGWVPQPLVVGTIGLAAGSCFLLIPQAWGWDAVGAYLALDAAVIVVMSRWSSRSHWRASHHLALAGGAAMAYAWHAFPQPPVVGASGTIDLIGNAVFAAGLVSLLIVAARKTADSGLPEASHTAN
jgi:hypothetical protein